MTGAPLFSSGFRPFFLLGAAYGPLVIASWFAPQTGFWGIILPSAPAALVHAHELLFGFSVAI
ncbi:MAG: NnrS family protein, partial [bacterium]